MFKLRLGRAADRWRSPLTCGPALSIEGEADQVAGQAYRKGWDLWRNTTLERVG